MKIYEYKLKCGEELKETIEYCRDVPSLVAVLMVLSQAIKELCDHFTEEELFEESIKHLREDQAVLDNAIEYFNTDQKNQYKLLAQYLYMTNQLDSFKVMINKLLKDFYDICDNMSVKVFD